MPELSIFKIILYNLVYVIPMTIIGYFMFIKDLRHEEEVSEKKDKGKGLLALLTYTSPIYISVIINLLTGLPFYIALIGSIVFSLSNK
jgi:nicotinamide riboside transporter PnuC